MNTIKDLRATLADEMARLQPPAGLERRVLQQALGGAAVRPARGVVAGDAIRSWKADRRTPLAIGVRAMGLLAAVLIVVLVVAGILVGGRLLRDRGVVPAGSTHFLPHPGSGMVSPSTGWLIDAGQHVQRTTDGGAQWTNVGPPGYLPSVDDSGYFLDATHAWLTETVGTRTLSVATYRTGDGGRTWNLGQAISTVGVYGLWPRLYFLDPSHGWLLLLIDPKPLSDTDVIEEAMYGTSDGGLHWVPLSNSDHAAAADCCQWSAAAFASLQDGWLVVDGSGSPPGTSQLLATHDGGKTWEPQALPLASSGLTCPCRIDAPTVLDQKSAAVVVSGWDGQPRLFMTSDVGRSWKERSLPGELLGLRTVFFPGQQSGTTGFQTSNDVDFVDARHGWTVAGVQAIPSPGANLPIVPGSEALYRTDDGGLTWVPVEAYGPWDDLSSGRTYDLYFVDLNHGFVVQWHLLWKTDDGGRTWTLVGPYTGVD